MHVFSKGSFHSIHVNFVFIERLLQLPSSFRTQSISHKKNHLELSGNIAIMNDRSIRLFLHIEFLYILELPIFSMS